METHMKDFHLPFHSRSVFSKIGVVPARKRICSLCWSPKMILGPATTQNLVVKFDGEIRGGVLVEIV